MVGDISLLQTCGFGALDLSTTAYRSSLTGPLTCCTSACIPLSFESPPGELMCLLGSRLNTKYMKTSSYIQLNNIKLNYKDSKNIST